MTRTLLCWSAFAALGLGPVVLGLFWAGVVAVGKGAIDGSATLGIAVAVTALALFTTSSLTSVAGWGLSGSSPAAANFSAMM